MNWTLAWSPESKADCLGIHYETTWRIVQAVLTWAASGDGQVAWIGDDLFRVSARGGFAVVEIDESEDQIRVLRLYADSPLSQRSPLLDEPIHDEESGE